MALSAPSLPGNTAEAIAAIKSLTAKSAHLQFAIAGLKHDAISFEASEAISTPFSASLYVLTNFETSWLGQPGVATLTDASGNKRTLAGIVTQQRDRGLNARNQLRVEIKLQPRLWLLMQSSDNRVYQGLSIPDIVTSVLAQHDINSAARCGISAKPMHPANTVCSFRKPISNL